MISNKLLKILENKIKVKMLKHKKYIFFILSKRYVDNMWIICEFTVDNFLKIVDNFLKSNQKCGYVDKWLFLSTGFPHQQTQSPPTFY